MSWICPWCGAENFTDIPEGRQTTKCRACKIVVPSREGLQKMKDEDARKLREQWDEIDNEITHLEFERDNLEDRIREIEAASFDREKVRVIASDQKTLPFEVAA